MAFCDRLVEGQVDIKVVTFRFRSSGEEMRFAQCRRMAIQDVAGPKELCGVFVDVTEAYRREEALLDLVPRDPVTGLHNRRGFKREAERVLRSTDPGLPRRSAFLRCRRNRQARLC